MGYLYLERYIQRTRKPLSSNRRINNKKVASEGREKFFNINVQFIIPRGWNKSSSLICFYGGYCLIWLFFLGFLKKYVIIESRRRWWNGRHACFRRMCPYGCEGSNPFLRIRKNERVKWLSHFYFYPILIQIIPNSIIGLLLSKHRSSEQMLPSLALLLEHWP